MEATLDELLRSLPAATAAELDTGAIRRDWVGRSPDYPLHRRRMPLPVWARRGLPDDGPRAWEILSREAGEIDPSRAFCIYIHIPFCAAKCGFCDCYSFRLGRHREEHCEAYVSRLIGEMRAWSALGNLSQRPVSTVHLGGGTPTFLDREAFLRLARECRSLFAAGADTEWALETTSSEYTADMADTMAGLDFRRIHFGVQSLDPSVRTRIQRREPPETVLEKIRRSVARGAIVSVDLIVGLPGQTPAGLLGDIDRLADAGVDGFSVYELQHSSRNNVFWEQNNLRTEDFPERYFLFLIALQRLDRRGYRKTLFNHFSRERDANLYFTFPQRGEDCLALGTIADGMFGDYHYRHPPYAAYNRLARDGFPGLQGGIRRDARENALFPAITAVLSGTFSPEILLQNAFLPPAAGARILERWRTRRLVNPAAGGKMLLSANGSWFTGNMIDDLIQSSL